MLVKMGSSSPKFGLKNKKYLKFSPTTQLGFFISCKQLGEWLFQLSDFEKFSNGSALGSFRFPPKKPCHQLKITIGKQKPRKKPKTGPRNKKKRILSIESWLFNRDPYNALRHDPLNNPANFRCSLNSHPHSHTTPTGQGTHHDNCHLTNHKGPNHLFFFRRRLVLLRRAS